MVFTSHHCPPLPLNLTGRYEQLQKHIQKWCAAIAQLVQRFTTSWTVRESNVDPSGRAVDCLLGLRVRIPPGGINVLCVLYSKDKRQKPGQSEQRSMDKVHRQNKTKSRWRWHFPHPSRPALGYRVSFPGVKRPEFGVNHPPAPSAEVKERVELYFYSAYVPSWPVLGRLLPVPIYLEMCQLNLNNLVTCVGLSTVPSLSSVNC